jgi:hypothetical protein
MAKMLFQWNPQTKRQIFHTDFQGEAITPSDSADLVSGPAIGIAVTGAGAVAVQLDGGSTAVLTLSDTNEPYLCQVKRVLATGTTATGIYALYAGATMGNV